MQKKSTGQCFRCVSDIREVTNLTEGGKSSATVMLRISIITKFKKSSIQMPSSGS